jgi:DNA invertase Pin-like site-specific DNA recombinase
MALPAIENYDDDKLADLLNAVMAEQERRARLAAYPAQIAEMRAQYLEGGGDPALLEAAINPPD